MRANHRKAIEALDPEAVKKLLEPKETATIPYTELPESLPENQFYHEWNTYRREAGRLLDEGHEGKWVVIKEHVILGLYDTRDQAKSAGMQKALLNEFAMPFAVKQVLAREPILRLRGYNLPLPCKNLHLPLAEMAS